MKAGVSNILWYAKVDNLTNQLAYSAASVLTTTAFPKAPLPGRSLKVGNAARFFKRSGPRQTRRPADILRAKIVRMNQLVFVSLFPVVLLIAIGFIAGRAQWIRAGAIKDLSNLIFLLLTPALLFRTMSKVRIEQLDFTPVLAYFLAVIILFGGTLLLQGFNRRAAVLALANTFSNTVMIGIALIGLMYGPEGLVTLFTLVSVHSLVLLTSATVVLELAVAHEQKAGYQR